MKINRHKIMLLIVFFLTLFISSCQTERINQTQLQLVRYSLKITDLPKGWKFTGKDWGTDFGGESYTIAYERDVLVFVSNSVAIYPSEIQAEQVYKDWEDEWFYSSPKQIQLDVSFFPIDQHDEHRFECSQLYQGDPIVFCVYLQRHDKLINFVRISSDSRNKYSLSFEEIYEILGVLDSRLNEVVLD